MPLLKGEAVLGAKVALGKLLWRSVGVWQRETYSIVQWTIGSQSCNEIAAQIERPETNLEKTKLEFKSAKLEHTTQ